MVDALEEYERKTNTMTTAKGYSLWYVPDGNFGNQLISSLSKNYNSPSFEPHLTLIGEVEESEEEIIIKTSQLAKIVKPFRINLTGKGYADSYFQCLFLKAKPSSQLTKLNEEARNIFNMPSAVPYTPHLSLMYGNLPENEKIKILDDIFLDKSFDFDVNAVYLFKTKGTPEEWYKVREFPLCS